MPEKQEYDLPYDDITYSVDFSQCLDAKVHGYRSSFPQCPGQNICATNYHSLLREKDVFLASKLTSQRTVKIW